MIAGRYTLEREIGRGGAGTVHLGEDTVLGRRVAIKRIGLMPGADTPDMERAEREARLAAALNHPHVVSVFDLVADGDAHWLVMEYVDGQTLGQLIREQGSLPARRAAGIVAQAADALTDAHKGGIVHRDVKPSNIFVTSRDEAKLGDFGIARASTDTALTQTGLVTGSPAYLAPEVASGASATPASDVWSLGATLFHAASGKPPYDVGDNLVGGLYRIVHDEPPRLPADHPLAPVLAVTMQRDPARRWPMERVRDELRRISRGEKGTAPPAPAGGAVPDPDPTPQQPQTAVMGRSGRGVPAHDPGRPAWLWLAAAAVVLVALIVAGVLWLRPGDGERPDPPVAGEGTSQSPTPTPTETSTQSPEEVAAEMDAFISDYLTKVTADPRAAFDMLSPDFQAESGGFDGYLGWWGTVRSARLADINSDPDGLTVEYRVRYVMKNGRRNTEEIALQLVRHDDGYLIDGEAG